MIQGHGKLGKVCVSPFRFLNAYGTTLTCFFQGCRGNGLLAEMKGLDVNTFNAGEHNGKASLPLQVLPRRSGAGATGSYYTEGAHVIKYK